MDDALDLHVGERRRVDDGDGPVRDAAHERVRHGDADAQVAIVEQRGDRRGAAGERADVDQLLADDAVKRGADLGALDHHVGRVGAGVGRVHDAALGGALREDALVALRADRLALLEGLGARTLLVGDGQLGRLRLGLRAARRGLRCAHPGVEDREHLAALHVVADGEANLGHHARRVRRDGGLVRRDHGARELQEGRHQHRLDLGRGDVHGRAVLGCDHSLLRSLMTAGCRKHHQEPHRPHGDLLGEAVL